MLALGYLPSTKTRLKGQPGNDDNEYQTFLKHKFKNELLKYGRQAIGDQRL